MSDQDCQGGKERDLALPFEKKNEKKNWTYKVIVVFLDIFFSWRLIIGISYYVRMFLQCLIQQCLIE